MLATASIVVCAASAQAAVPNIKEGLWEITVKMDMAGMPGGMPAQTTQRCITAKDMEDPRKVAPADDREKQGKDTVQMTMNYAGRYLGACKPGSK